MFWKSSAKNYILGDKLESCNKDELIEQLRKTADDLVASDEKNRQLQTEKKILESDIDAHKAAIDQLSAVVHRDRLRVQNEQRMYGGFNETNKNREANQNEFNL